MLSCSRVQWQVLPGQCEKIALSFSGSRPSARRSYLLFHLLIYFSWHPSLTLWDLHRQSPRTVCLSLAQFVSCGSHNPSLPTSIFIVNFLCGFALSSVSIFSLGWVALKLWHLSGAPGSRTYFSTALVFTFFFCPSFDIFLSSRAAPSSRTYFSTSHFFTFFFCICFYWGAAPMGRTYFRHLFFFTFYLCIYSSSLAGFGSGTLVSNVVPRPHSLSRLARSQH